MTLRLPSRRGAFLGAACGLIASCGSRDDPSVPASPTPVSDPGRLTMVDELTSAAPFDALSVTRVGDGELTSWDLTYSRGGTPLLRYRLQGAWDGAAPQVDGYQRLEEATALDGAATLAGEIVVPRSNWEFAFQIVVDGDAQFVPYHGTPTAFPAHEASVVLDGEEVSPDVLPLDESREVAVFALSQTVRARHPARPGQDLVEIATTTTWTAEGRGRVDGTWHALQDVEIGSAYGPMLPFRRDVFDQVVTDDGQEVGLPGGSAPETVPLPGATAARLESSRHGWSAAIAWLRPERTLRAEGGDRPTDVFLQARDDGIGKIYPQVWEPGDAVVAGTRWDFEAEWFVSAPTSS